jgi:hypothetical protein
MSCWMFEGKIIENYAGSALNYIRRYIIPSLPERNKLINFTSSIYLYLEGSSIRYIRKLKNYANRGYLYKNGSLPFTVTDNEPALWAYMECFEQSLNSFEYYHENSMIPVAFALKADEKKIFNSRFTYGKKKRETTFSQAKLKHCHILDCSPRGESFLDLDIDQRMLRLISPMNHFAFPAPRHYKMRGGDIGESKQFLNLVKHTLYHEYYKTNEEKECFLKFLKAAGDDLLFSSDAKDFNIEFNLKESSNKKDNDSRLISRPNSINQNNVNLLKLNKGLSVHNKKIHYFKIDEKWRGKEITVRVEFQRGGHQNFIYIYNHDEVYNRTIEHLSALKCWANNKCYTSTTSIPGWASGYVDKIEIQSYIDNNK